MAFYTVMHYRQSPQSEFLAPVNADNMRNSSFIELLKNLYDNRHQLDEQTAKLICKAQEWMDPGRGGELVLEARVIDDEQYHDKQGWKLIQDPENEKITDYIHKGSIIIGGDRDSIFRAKSIAGIDVLDLRVDFVPSGRH